MSEPSHRIDLDQINANGIDIPFKVVGSGPALVMLHGSVGDLRMFDAIVPLLSRDFTVVRYDQRDSGACDPASAPYTMQDLADDAIALLTVLGHRRSHFFGTQFGALIGQQLFMRHSQHVDKLILGGAARDVSANNVARDRLTKYLDVAIPSENPAVRREAALYFAPETLASSPALIDEFISIRPRRDASMRRRRIGAVNSFGMKDETCRIVADTLVIAGRHDQITPPQYAWELANALPKASFVMSYALGHEFYREAPAWTARIILQHLCP